MKRIPRPVPGGNPPTCAVRVVAAWLALAGLVLIVLSGVSR
jgi:hypothetical protein